MNVWLLLRRLRNARRMMEVQRVVLKYGLGPLLMQVGLGRFWGRVEEGPAEGLGRTVPERVRLALQELGPTAIKFGQMLSTRHDLLPAEYVEELSKLQDEVPPFPFEQAREQIERELDAPLTELFREVNPIPLASASIGQVHEAVLLSGEKVALKVQRPGVERIIERDLAILFDLADLLQGRLPIARHYDLVQVVKEFAESIRDEMVYTIEARNAEQLASNLAEERSVYIPKVYWSLTTQRLLTLERLEGIKISEVEALRRAGHDLRRLAKALANVTLRQILMDGFFHADPHPGNFIVLSNGRIGLVDFGIMGHLDARTREHLVNVFLGIVTQDTDRVVENLLEIGFITEDTPLAAFRHDLDRLLTRYLFLPRKEFRIGELLRRLLEGMYEYAVSVPAEFTLLAKTLVMVEGLCLALDPDFEVREAVEPMVRRLLGMHLEPRHLLEELADGLKQVAQLARHMPRQVSSVLHKAETGELKVRIEHHRFEQLWQRWSILANRLAFSIMVSAITLASALLLQNAPDFPLRSTLGVSGFLLAATMAFWLLLSIIRSGRL